ncbi:TonB-dependent receptor plug domain-containing protein [Microbulbifer hydrolyticus]|uniref:Outer membrane receptor protein involved in Fe transport n=1 Tax=Microbulbifer hydrolyticus TaxID=48074 RepID=A0A6P1TEC0_9GAMM|nr:TonB-dependent receptor [Microbulbifer hydrolyticus]MBB5212351.1 outer membrane receptor protein involved in Fe transport [Microbulbifer hydrolyticus]QHQ39993.1 TonB-dependent receptor [Microbulbifer hydrolyticus]
MKKNLLSAAVTAAILVPAMPTFAQQDAQMVEEVVVTGSRIKRQDLESVSPFTSISSEEFKISGNLNVEQKLAELPQTMPSFGPSSNNPGDGTARVDLRGLGSYRTVVLVNGRRYIPSTQTGVVDLNTIPGTLLKNVDVVTGGASAVYGSDALAGIVNFQMVDDFEGVQITSLHDVTTEGDGAKSNIDLTMGGNFADGRGNAVVYASWSERESVMQGDRDFSSVALTESGGQLIAGGSSGIPGTLVFDTGTTFNSDGTSRAFQDPADRFNYAPDNYLQLPQERFLISSFAHYDISENATAYGEMAFAHNEVPQELAPTPAFTTISVNPNTPFFDAAYQDELRQMNIDAGVDVNTPVDLFVGRRMVENGSRQSLDTRDAFRILAGVRGDINDDWSYDTYYSHSNLENTNLLNNDVAASRFRQALLVTDDGMACQDTSNGCAPLNIWGAGNISQEAIDFINVGATNKTSITQEVFSASVSGSLATLPTADEAVGVVFGIEHRNDESTYRPDSFLSAGDVLGFNAGKATVGSYSADEVFTEVNVPLVQGKAGVESLTLWGAARYSDYSNIGGVTSYATALNYAPIDMVKIRAGFQQAVRAPNVSELFLGQSNGFPSADDPCAAGNVTAETDTALCSATGVTAGSFNQANSQIEGLFGGNPDLQEETSNTFTFGVVVEPMDGLDVALDYYNIEIEDAIDVLGGGVNNVLDLCYNVVKDISSPFCQAITRRSDGNVQIVEVLNENIGLIETSGIDLNVNYGTDLAFGIDGGSYLSVAFNSTYLLDFDQTPIADLPERVNYCAGSFGNTCGAPRQEFNWNSRITWSSGPLTLSALVRYLGESDDDVIANSDVAASDLVVPTIDAETYLDLSVGYAMSENLDLNVGIKNALDTEPTPLGDAQEQANTFPSTYDLLGPRYFLSASYKFD